MKFRSRLILGYATLAIIASVLFGVFYNDYLNQRFKTSIYNNAKAASTQVMSALEGEVQKMDQAILSLLSNLDVLDAIRDLSVKMAEPEENASEISTEKALIRGTIYTAYNLENFYRVLVYNQYGYIATSSSLQERVVDTDVKVGDIPWLSRVKGTKGKNVLVALHEDDWGVSEKGQRVFSRVKEIQGDNLGFIEIQQTEEYLEELLTFSNDTFRGIVLDKNGEVFWCSDGLNAEEYSQYFELENSIFDKKNEVNGLHELICTDVDAKTGLRLITIQAWSDAAETISSGVESAIAIGMLFFIFSLVFIIFMANFLTSPLQQLRENMENKQLSNMTDEIKIKSSDADIQALTQSYKYLLERLSCSMEREKKLSILQLQAQFDTLQAQINPHFIYNVLNVISARGIQNDDEIICEICGQLASMLRYSTNTKNRFATIREELEYTEEYFYLIKTRYEDKVSLKIDVDRSILDVVVPKTAIQQLVENCISHGFGNRAADMRVNICGCVEENRWYIEVSDNGQGFRQESLQDLNDKMARIQKHLFQEKSNIELEIGGMGLLNTYARLLLIYCDSLTFELKNTPTGAAVVFSADMQTDGGEENV